MRAFSYYVIPLMLISTGLNGFLYSRCKKKEAEFHHKCDVIEQRIDATMEINRRIVEENRFLREQTKFVPAEAIVLPKRGLIHP